MIEGLKMSLHDDNREIDWFEKFGIKRKEIDSEKLELFKNKIADLEKIYLKYDNEYINFKQSAEKAIERYEYSNGGLGVHRGFYCPCPVIEFLIGNVKRGRILKKKSKKYTYEYGFDKNGKLIKIKKVLSHDDGQFEEEYLIYDGNTVYGVEFTESEWITGASKCSYENGLITRYEHIDFFGEENLDQYNEYYYENNILTEVINYWNILPYSSMYEEDEYFVQYNDDGKIERLIPKDELSND
jgi:hypothetical protein